MSFIKMMEAKRKKLQETNEVKPTDDGKCPDGYVLSDDKTKCLAKESVLGKLRMKEDDEADASTSPDENGNCPEGYELSPDKTRCIIKTAGEPKNEESYDIGHYDPQFVVNGQIDVTLENGMVIRFEDLEAIELIENKAGHLQIGSSKNVVVFDKPEIVYQFLESVLHKDQIEVEERDVTIEDAIKSDIPVKKVAEELIRKSFTANTSIKSMIEQNQGLLKIRARRRIRNNSTVQMKAGHIRSEAFYSSTPMKSAPKPSSMKKVKMIRTTPKVG